MADNTTEKAQQTARKATAAAEETVGQGAERVSETVEKIGDTARRASETASRSSEELLTIGRDNMEGVAIASQAMLKGASELGSLWASFWNEQLTTGMEAMRSLAESDSWDEALKVQNEFTRSSSRSGFLLAGPQERRADIGDGHEQLHALPGVRAPSRRASAAAAGLVLRSRDGSPVKVRSPASPRGFFLGPSHRKGWDRASVAEHPALAASSAYPTGACADAILRGEYEPIEGGHLWTTALGARSRN
jgi:hypothetical protein